MVSECHLHRAHKLPLTVLVGADQETHSRTRERLSSTIAQVQLALSLARKHTCTARGTERGLTVRIARRVGRYRPISFGSLSMQPSHETAEKPLVGLPQGVQTPCSSTRGQGCSGALC